MDSLTRDVERIFNQNRDENDGKEEAEKSAVYRAAEFAFDFLALLMAYATLALGLGMVVILVERAGKAFFKKYR